METSYSFFIALAFFVAFFGLIGVVVGAVASRRAQKTQIRKTEAEAQKAEAESVSLDVATQAAIRAFYKDVIADVTERLGAVELELATIKETHVSLVASLHQDIVELKTTNSEASTHHAQAVEALTASISGLQTLVSEQKETIEKLQNRIEELHKLVAALQRQIVAGGDTPVHPAEVTGATEDAAAPVSMTVESMTVKDMTVASKPTDKPGEEKTP